MATKTKAILVAVILVAVFFGYIYLIAKYMRTPTRVEKELIEDRK